jgi:hypothetical protein
VQKKDRCCFHLPESDAYCPAERIIADKRTRVDNLVGDPEVLTCAQPANKCAECVRGTLKVSVTPVRKRGHIEGVCDTRT